MSHEKGTYLSVPDGCSQHGLERNLKVEGVSDSERFLCVRSQDLIWIDQNLHV